MGVRVFLKNNTHVDYNIQTYYINDDSLYTLVLEDGSFTVVDNVSHMIKIS